MSSYSGPSNPPPSTARDKALPSPPIAQVIDPNSPPKAQRTLVDAESGTPSEEDWPILRPENITPLMHQIPRVSGMDVQQQRSASLGAVPARVATSYFAIAEHSYANMMNTSGAPEADFSPSLGESSQSQQGRQFTESRRLSSNNPYANAAAFHAISTDSDSAMESPLARKKSAVGMILVPPRISSKRSSLPLPDQNVLGFSTPRPSLRSRQAELDTEKWPLLQEQDTEQHVGSDSLLSPEEQTATAMSAQDQPQVAHDLTLRVSQPTGVNSTVQYATGSLRSNSSWSMAAGSSLDGEPGTDHEDGTRVKHLSKHSSASEPGAKLTIKSDADAVLHGRDTPVPDVPSLSEKLRGKLPQESSLGAMAGRLSRQTMSRISNLTSRTSTPNLAEVAVQPPTPVKPTTPVKTITPAKINPIRSMQPARKSSVGGPSSPMSSLNSPTSQASVESKKPVMLSAVPSPEAKKADAAREHDQYSSVSDAGPSGLSRTTRARDVARLPGPHKLSTSQSTLSLRRNLPAEKLIPLTPLGEEEPTQGFSPVSASSPRVDESTGALSVQNRSDVKEQTTKKLNIKRSLRGMFQRAVTKRSEKQPMAIAPEQASTTGTKTSLARRIRNSTSRLHLPRAAEIKSELQDIPEPVTEIDQAAATEASTKDADRKAALSSLEDESANSATKPALMQHNTTAAAINNIVERIALMPVDSPDRLLGVEIAEVSQLLYYRPKSLEDIVLTVNTKQAVLCALECYQEAKQSAESAMRHARDAQWQVARAGEELLRLEELRELISKARLGDE
ncbi:hypothetical protein N0V83_007750 [Neocucurbitaria cava]|uniref:Uncharacterized protein n=1 Tax=Neocucurbitaria cava TaxID=798079 RepID=A0A9W8Y5E9_9PLEO|nr:hypothetical protein N0V83_007750 [Neocucurbitaria cava]